MSYDSIDIKGRAVCIVCMRACACACACKCVCVYVCVCVVIKGNSMCFDAVATCLTARASIERAGPCFFNKVGMGEIRCVECRLVVQLSLTKHC